MSGAELRSSLVKEQLASIDALGAVAARIRAEVPRPVSAIERSARMEWLPIDVLLDLLEATLRVLGAEEATVHWRLSTLRSFEIPLVRPFMIGALSLFNPSPATVLTLLPRLYSLLYRGIGTVRLESIEPGLLRVVHEAVPPVMLASRAWVASMAASYLATLDFLRAPEARVEAQLESTAGRCLFVLRWSPL